MVKSSIAQLIGVTVFQFAVSIVDPSILAQPLAPVDPTFAPGAVTTITAPTPSGSAKAELIANKPPKPHELSGASDSPTKTLRTALYM